MAAAKTPLLKPRSRTAAVCAGLQRWLIEYAMEWRLTDKRNASVLQGKIECFTKAINSSDAVVFVKPGGLCPFCNIASSALLKAHEEGSPPFTLHIADLLNDDREALRMMLNEPVLTWPVVFIRGQFLVGGGEAVAQMRKEGGALAGALQAERRMFVANPVEHVAHPRPLLLHQAGGGSWRGCQSYIYGNVLRAIAVLQICLLAGANELESRGMTMSTVPLLSLLALDSLLFTLAGPTPWSPLGCLATLIVWPRRGSIAPLVPYKVTFGALYFLMNVVALACRLLPEAITGADPASSSGVCGLIGSSGLIWTMLTNSAFLAIFRF